jgi:hypothetical protein
MIQNIASRQFYTSGQTSFSCPQTRLTDFSNCRTREDMELTHLGTLKTVLSEVLLLSREQRRFRLEMQAGLDRLSGFPFTGAAPGHSAGNGSEASRSKRDAAASKSSDAPRSKRNAAANKSSEAPRNKRDAAARQSSKSAAAVTGASEAEALRAAVDAPTHEAAGLYSALRGLREAALPAQAGPCPPPTCPLTNTLTTRPAAAEVEASNAPDITGSASSALIADEDVKIAADKSSPNESPKTSEVADTKLEQATDPSPSVPLQEEVLVEISNAPHSSDSVDGQSAEIDVENQDSTRDQSSGSCPVSAGGTVEDTSGILTIPAAVTVQTCDSPKPTERAAGESSAAANLGSSGGQNGDSAWAALRHISKEAAATATASGDVAFASVLHVDRQQAGTSTAGRRSAAFKFSHASEAALGAAPGPVGRNEQEKSELRGRTKLRQRPQQLEPVSIEPSHATHFSFSEESINGIDFSARRSLSESSSRLRDPAATAGADDAVRSFKAWSGRRQASRGDHGLARARFDNTGDLQEPSEEGLAAMSPISTSSRDGGWIAALAAALEDDESATAVDAEGIVDDT